MRSCAAAADSSALGIAEALQVSQQRSARITAQEALVSSSVVNPKFAPQSVRPEEAVEGRLEG